MKPITEQDIWDLMDGNCTSTRANYIHQQLQLEKHEELLQLYQTIQVLNRDLQGIQVVEPSTNFNAAVMAKLQPTPVAKPQLKTVPENQTSWKSMSRWGLLVFAIFSGLICLLQIAPASGSETMGSLGLSIIEGLEQLVEFTQQPVFLSSLVLIYVLGLLTLLDKYLKKRFRFN